MPTERKQIRKAIDEWFGGPLYSVLARNGFALPKEVDQREPLQMFRSQRQKIDVVGCRIAQRSGVEETELYAETGVFLRGVPHYSGVAFEGVENLPLKSTLDCHFRQNLKPSWLLSPSLSRRTTWRIKDVGPNLEKALADVLGKIESGGLQWFEKYADLRAAYRILTDKQEAGPNLPGDWGQVYGEKLVKGFLGLECQDWPTAVASLNDALAIANPHHTLDTSQPKRLYHRFESQIEAALSKARAEIRP